MENFKSEYTNSILNVAEQIFGDYEVTYHEVISEKKLQQLLYLANRQCLAEFGYALFVDTMIGQPDSPFSPEVAAAYTSQGIQGADFSSHDPNSISRQVWDNPACGNAMVYSGAVVDYYGEQTEEELDAVIQADQSWQNSRKGLFPQQEGDKILLLSDIQKDAAHIPAEFCFAKEWGSEEWQ